MAISVNNISLSVGAGSSKKPWFIDIDGEAYHFDSFSLHCGLLMPSTLSFVLMRDPDESEGDPRINACGSIIGKEVSLTVDTMGMGIEGNTETVEFRGFVAAASGSRSGTEYYISVEAMSWDALLDDNPTCRSYENKTLAEIVEDVVGDYGNINPLIQPRFTEVIPYCVQYNETNYQFLQRLARRYGEWLYNTGTQMVFGEIPKIGDVSLGYPSHDVPAYSMDVRVQHMNFRHVASSYNVNDGDKKEGIEEATWEYNENSEKAFSASTELYSKPTLQNLHSGGFAKPDSFDSRETVLNISTKTQARGEKAGMQTFSGSTYCSKVKIGKTLNIIDNYKTGMERSDVPQTSILVTEITHHFSLDNSYSNHFSGIADMCDYPPYANSDVYPVAPSCRAKVVDNEDPNGLGRIRVQFDWQKLLSEDIGEELITPWLRMAQPYAGGGKGFSFIPEIGEEVMIDFEGGNAERPYVKGTLYNGVEDVDQKWVANSNSNNQIKAIRTRNGHTIEVHDEGSDGFIRIYDNEKENYILTFSTDRKLIMLQSTGNIELYAKNDIIMHAGHDIKATADNDIITHSGHDTSETADNDMLLEATKDQERKAGKNIREQAGKNRTTNIGNNDELSVGTNQNIQIGGDKNEQIENTLQLFANNIRSEADNQILEYSTTHHIKANDQVAVNAGTRIDIKAGIVKVQ